MGVKFLVPVLAIVRTTIDSAGQADAAEQMQSPKWKTWLSNGAAAGGFAQWQDSAHLVGVAYNGMGMLPPGMKKTPLVSQELEFNFKCNTPPAGDDEPMFDVYNTARFVWKAFDGNRQYIQHMEGNGVHVLHESAGNYERAYGNRHFVVYRRVLDCADLEVSVSQRVMMTTQLLQEQQHKAMQALASAGYTSEEAQAAVQAYAGKLVASLAKQTSFDNVEEWMEKHEQEKQELVESGALKKVEDYDLVQNLHSMLQSRASDSWGGFFKLGSGRFTNTHVSAGESVLAFEFVQDCSRDTRFLEERHHMGPMSPANCARGKRGLAMLHGAMGDSGQFGYGSHFSADRLVMYLERADSAGLEK